MTLRNRLALSSLLVSSLILIVAGWFVLREHRDASVEALDASLTVRLDDLAALDEQNLTPAVFGISEAEDTLAMVVAANGSVTLTTDRFGDSAELLAAIGTDGSASTASLSSFGETRGIEEMRLLAGVNEVGDTAVVGQSMRGVNTSVSDLRMNLLTVGPILALAAAALTRFIVGRALAPVDAMRAEAAAISLTKLDRRIPSRPGRDELAALASSLNEMLSRLETSAETQRRLVADVAHELRSPLAALVAQLEVDLTHPDRADWPTTAADALDEGRRLQSLINNLLLLASLDNDEHEPGSALVDLDELIHDTAQRLERNSPIAVDRTRVGAGVVRGNADQLQRCIQNVLDNAIRHANASVAISLAEDEEHVELTVTDDGPGIPAADRERIFERFYRISAARDRETGGTGLGLAIVRELVTAHGGSVEARPAEPTGTSIVMLFPVAAGAS